MCYLVIYLKRREQKETEIKSKWGGQKEGNAIQYYKWKQLQIMLLKFPQYHFAKSDKQLKSLNQSFSIEWLERLQFKYVLI